MYKDIIDIKFIPGKIKINNNFTYINKLENIEKHWYLDNKLVLESLKKNQEFLMKIMKLDNIKDKVLNLFIWHANFEMIHPFPDGNGRVGRILLDNELMKIGLQPLILNHHIKKDYFKIIQLCEDKNISNELLETIVFIQNESKRTFIDSYEELNTEKTTGNKKLKMI